MNKITSSLIITLISSSALLAEPPATNTVASSTNQPGMPVLDNAPTAAITPEKENKYFFLVAGSVNKLEIKRAVEELYKVSVSKVNTVNYRGKLKRERTMTYGRTAGWKRAIVTLAEGSKIELT